MQCSGALVCVIHIKVCQAMTDYQRIDHEFVHINIILQLNPHQVIDSWIQLNQS